MEYNLVSDRMILPEYGVNIQKMVDHVVQIDDKEKRTKAAHTIISIMGNLFPHLRDITDFKHKLWDHLALMSNFKLDIDYPYDPPVAENFQTKPEKVPYANHTIRALHYGKMIEMMIEQAALIEDDQKRLAVVRNIAIHMKKAYVTWNKSNIEDTKIADDLNRLSKGKFNYTSEELNLPNCRDLIASNNNKPQNRGSNNKKRPFKKQR